MTDYRFHDIVIESNSMIGPEGEYHTAVCKTCSTKHKVTRDEFQLTDLYKVVRTEDGFGTVPASALEHCDNYKEIMKYVAEMRAWNCHHEGEKPLDGFPDEPDASSVNFGQ